MAHSKIDNTFNGAMDKLKELSSVFREGGRLEAACSDDCDLGSVRSAFEKLMGEMREAHTEATMEESVDEAEASIPYRNIPMRLPDGRLNPDHPFNYGKRPGDNRTIPEPKFKRGETKPQPLGGMRPESVEETGMGAPDYNPAKASSGGPGYASMPQQVKLAGDSIWDKEDTNPPMVTITDYEVVEEDGYVSVTVEHDGPWTIYTDSGFEKEISEMIGMEVSFSEQGMQEDGRAHLEGTAEMESSDLSRLKMLAGTTSI